MKLEEVLSKELYGQVKAAIDEVNGKETDKLKHVRYADLSEGEYVSKEKYSALETDKGSVAEQLGKANELIEQLKNGTEADESMQGKIGEYETTISALTTENEKLKTESALKFALQDAKAVDVEYLAFKVREKGEIKLDSSGKIKGIEDTISSLKTQFPSQFVNGTGRRIEERRLETGETPNDGEINQEAFDKMGYKERVQLINENPDLYSSLADKK